MGLDMYLNRRVGLKSSITHATDNDNEKVAGILGGANVVATHEVCYWRKFNALHKYFIDKFGDDGTDNCRDFELGIEDLRELLDMLEELRSRIKMGNGYVAMTEQWLSKNDIGERKVGDVIKGKELKELKLKDAGDCVKRCVIEDERGDEYFVVFQRVDKVVLNTDVCEEMLPTEDGFFFGCTEYDEWYVKDIERTIEELKRIIKEHEALVKSGVDECDIWYYYRAWY